MKKEMFSLILMAAVTASLTACGVSSAAPAESTTSTESEATADPEAAAEADVPSNSSASIEEITEEKNENIVLTAANAAVTGTGLAADGTEADSVYVEQLAGITPLGGSTLITYTVENIVEGNYDISLNIAKCFFQMGSTYFAASINNGPRIAFPIKLAPVQEADYSDLFVQDAHLVRKNIPLKSGDTITISCLNSFEMPGEDGSVTSLLPVAVGDITLSPASFEETEIDPADPLSGLTIGWLGSSVTYGMMSGGYSMANAIADGHNGSTSLNYSISGTTLVNNNELSYVAREKLIDPEQHFDLFIVQLSTNDATNNMPLGKITSGKDPAEFDDTTIAGAMETVISYAQTTWNCPVMFYTGTWYDSELYQQMTELLPVLEEKWGIGIIDLWNNQNMKAVIGTEQYNTYMADDIHPTFAGYTEWWTPVFEQSITEFLTK